MLCRRATGGPLGARSKIGSHLGAYQTVRRCPTPPTPPQPPPPPKRGLSLAAGALCIVYHRRAS